MIRLDEPSGHRGFFKKNYRLLRRCLKKLMPKQTKNFDPENGKKRGE
jgi:hypothetical protein